MSRTEIRTLVVLPDDGIRPVLAAIAGAKKSILVKMFLFSEPRLIRALVAAHKRGVKVRVMLNPALRDYRIPAFADIPRSEIYFADTYDKIGPLGAKAQGECAINCVAPAIVNAVADATGVRFTSLPLSPERIFDRLGS